MKYWRSAAAKLCGTETVWKYVLETKYIIFGTDLVKKVKVQCERSRNLRKKTTDAQMGPISKYNVMIAPAFYGTQLAICGPFKAYSMHHKRIRIKVCLRVYCCMSTSTTSVKVMDNYSTQPFIKLFIRFSCEFG